MKWYKENAVVEEPSQEVEEEKCLNNSKYLKPYESPLILNSLVYCHVFRG